MRDEFRRRVRVRFARYRKLFGEHEVESAIDFGLVKALRNYQPALGRFRPYAWRYVKSELRDLFEREMRWQRMTEANDEAVEATPSECDLEVEAFRGQLVAHLGPDVYDDLMRRAAWKEPWDALARSWQVPQRAARERIARALQRLSQRFTPPGVSFVRHARRRAERPRK